jgi:hypothetical protein
MPGCQTSPRPCSSNQSQTLRMLLERVLSVPAGCLSPWSFVTDAVRMISNVVHICCHALSCLHVPCTLHVAWH